jgi:hypothetical protein
MKAWMPARRYAGIAVAAVGVWLGSAGAASAATNNIFTVAGNGLAGFTGDNGPATGARINSGFGVASTPDGGFVIADAFNNRVRRVGPNGIVTTIAGTGVAGYSGDGGLATAAKLTTPVRVAVKPDGSIVIADYGNVRVREVSPAGVITTIAGTGIAGDSGDGGPATAAKISQPLGLAVAADGSVLIADRGSARVRRVAPGGTISTIAGTGTAGFSGDGGPATGAMLHSPEGLAIAADGGVLIADSDNDRVRRVAPGGTISTFAGSGTDGDSGDGGPATAAAFRLPRGVAVAPDGSVLIADYTANRVRRVAPDGVIGTVAGTGAVGYSGDGVPATAAKLNSPTDVVLAAAGGFLIADFGNVRVRWVDADLRALAGSPAPPPAAGGAPAPATGPVAAKLAVALGFSSITTKGGRTVSLRYASTVDAKVTLRLRRNGHTVKKVVRNAHDGRNSIRLRLPSGTGRYTLDLKAETPDGQVATDRAVLRIKRR